MSTNVREFMEYPTFPVVTEGGLIHVVMEDSVTILVTTAGKNVMYKDHPYRINVRFTLNLETMKWVPVGRGQIMRMDAAYGATDATASASKALTFMCGHVVDTIISIHSDKLDDASAASTNNKIRELELKIASYEQKISQWQQEITQLLMS